MLEHCQIKMTKFLSVLDNMFINIATFIFNFQLLKQKLKVGGIFSTLFISTTSFLSLQTLYFSYPNLSGLFFSSTSNKSDNLQLNVPFFHFFFWIFQFLFLSRNKK